jgi:L-histidine N-alpha-methyltransferase
VTRGLTRRPKELSPKWLYDDRGCAIYDEITRLPEYYPFLAEQDILGTRVEQIADLTRADTVVELGSGTSDKTQRLLDALSNGGHLRRFVPFDVAESAVRDAANAISNRLPGVAVTGIVGDFEQHLSTLPDHGRKLVAFFGGTIGNLVPDARRALLCGIRAMMQPGDALLLGTDLVKDRTRLLNAYDDTSGTTARFNKNLLAMLNRELDADFELDRFDHVVQYDDERDWIEMRLRSRGDQVVPIRGLGLTVEFADGEDLRTEISAKFRRETLEAELAAAGLSVSRWWTDGRGDYALSLSVPSRSIG